MDKEKAELALREGKELVIYLQQMPLSGAAETVQQLCDALAEAMTEIAKLRKGRR